MKELKILTDSCCSLNSEEVRELGVTVLPLTFMIDGRTYLDTTDHADLSPEDFFRRIGEGAECSTAAVNVGQYEAAMREIAAEGNDILCICFSGALSSTYQSACIAAGDVKSEFPESEIRVVDSLSACRGLGMLIYRTVNEIREKQLSIDEAEAFVLRERDRQAHWFLLDDLNHLKRGGRVSAVIALAGTALGIKPIMHCDADGKLTSFGKARGSKAALKALVDRMELTGTQLNASGTVFICHADCPDYVEYISALLTERFGITDIRTDYICPVIGAHTGCGTLGLFFECSER